MLKGPAAVMMYKLVYSENSSSLSWWDGSCWNPTGEMHKVDEIHKQLGFMGALKAFTITRERIVHEIWTIGG